MSTLRIAAQIYLASLTTIAVMLIGIAVAAGGTGTYEELALAALLSGLLAAALRTPLPFGPNAHLLLDTAVVLSAVLLLPPGLALPVAAAGPLLANLPRRAGWEEAVFGSAQTVLQAAAGVLVLAATGFWERDRPFENPVFLIGVVSAGLVVHIVNTLAVAGMLAFEGQEAPWSAWRRIVIPDPTEAAGFVAQWGLALLAAVVADAHVWALILLVLPGAVVLGALDRHVRLRIAAEQQLVDQAHHDPLTGLLNRARFTECLSEGLTAGAVGKALLFLDLDHFKAVNDSLGHEAGDHLLKEVAMRIDASLGPADIAGRLGGDEFVVFATGDQDQALAVANRIAAAMAAPFWVKDRHLHVTSSIGIAQVGDAGHDVEELLRNADVALYRAKAMGRNRTAVYDAALGAAARSRATLPRTLQEAIEQDGLWLAYQPQIELVSGRVVALEALVRCESPEHGSLHPHEFLELAESSGLILPLGRWVLNEACRAAQRWADRLPDPPAVAVNIWQSQLADPQLPADVLDALASSRLPADRLRLEIAEGAAVGDAALTVTVLRKLAAMGVQLILDDFGSGTSSLPHLAELPVVTLALDRALTAPLGQSPRSEAIVRAVTSAAFELGIAVAAKGIERELQAQRLRAFGCAFGQGHLYGPALPEAEALDRLAISQGVELAQAS